MTPKRTNADGDFLTDDDHLDPEVLTKDLPWAIKGMAKDFIEKLNTIDTNKDGKDDIPQVAAVLKKAVPVIAALSPYINWKGLLNKFVDDPAVVHPDDRSEVKRHMAELNGLGDELSKALEAKENANK